MRKEFHIGVSSFLLVSVFKSSADKLFSAGVPSYLFICTPISVGVSIDQVDILKLRIPLKYFSEEWRVIKMKVCGVFI